MEKKYLKENKKLMTGAVPKKDEYFSTAPKSLLRIMLESSRVISICRASVWFRHMKQIPFPFEKRDYVICTWYEYNSRPDGMMTIAVCKSYSVAKAAYRGACMEAVQDESDRKASDSYNTPAPKEYKR